MKYALLDNNQIKVGPRDYNRGFWDRYLEEVGIESGLPWTYDSQDTIIVTDAIKIVAVAEPVTPSYNTRTEQLAGPYWDVTQTPITGHYDVVDQPLESAKNSLKAQVAINRYNKEVSGIKVTVQSTEVNIGTNRGQDRDIWLQSYVLMEDTDTLKYKFRTDLWMDLAKTEVKSIFDAIKTHVQDAFAWEASKIAEIDAITTKENLESVDIEYPEVA